MPKSDQCARCAHYHMGQFTCDDFPDRIPDEIFTGLVDHSKRYPGDHGIRFEPYKDRASDD